MRCGLLAGGGVNLLRHDESFTPTTYGNDDERDDEAEQQQRGNAKRIIDLCGRSLSGEPEARAQQDHHARTDHEHDQQQSCAS